MYQIWHSDQSTGQLFVSQPDQTIWLLPWLLVLGGSLGERARGGCGLPGKPRGETLLEERVEQSQSHFHPGGKGQGVATGRIMERCHCKLMRGNIKSVKCENSKEWMFYNISWAGWVGLGLSLYRKLQGKIKWTGDYTICRDFQKLRNFCDQTFMSKIWK